MTDLASQPIWSRAGERGGLEGWKKSGAEIEQLVAEFETRGLSHVEFCQHKGLSLATLARYRKRQANGNPARESRRVAVEIDGLVLALAGGRRIEVGRGFDAPTLVQLLGVLDRI